MCTCICAVIKVLCSGDAPSRPVATRDEHIGFLFILSTLLSCVRLACCTLYAIAYYTTTTTVASACPRHRGRAPSAACPWWRSPSAPPPRARRRRRRRRERPRWSEPPTMPPGTAAPRAPTASGYACSTEQTEDHERERERPAACGDGRPWSMWHGPRFGGRWAYVGKVLEHVARGGAAEGEVAADAHREVDEQRDEQRGGGDEHVAAHAAVGELLKVCPNNGPPQASATGCSRGARSAALRSTPGYSAAHCSAR